MDTQTATRSLPVSYRTDTGAIWHIRTDGQICIGDYAHPGEYRAAAPVPETRLPDGYSLDATGTLVKPVKPRTCPTKVPGTKYSLLSYPTKMPCPSFGLPAGHAACPWKVTGHNTICSTCFAMKGKYTMANVKPSAMARFAWVSDCLRRGDDGTAEFVAVMTGAITRECARLHTSYFRWHDSGDIFSPAYAAAIGMVIDATPHIMHWIPTRGYRNPKMLAALVLLNTRPNVTVRPSALHFDAPAPVIPGLSAGSGASRTDYTCPAHYQENECKDCRACWDESTVPVFYRKH